MIPKVREVLQVYSKGGILGVKSYFTQEQMIIDPSTWSGEINNLINNNNLVYASAKIEKILFEFKL